MDVKYGKLCHKLSRNILNNRQDAEECVKDAYLGVWNAIPPAKPNPLRAYVCKVVRNISLKLYYKNKAEKRNSVYDIAIQELEDYLPAPNTVEGEIKTRELAHIIENFLDSVYTRGRGCDRMELS
ncbi:sigma-70 family RNA polymerase sigma factor [Oscillospiraceae bacterium 21-37]